MLRTVHFEVDTFDCLETVREGLSKTFNLHVLVIKLKSCNLRWYRLVVFFGDILQLECIGTRIFVIIFMLFDIMAALAAAREAAAKRVALSELLG